MSRLIRKGEMFHIALPTNLTLFVEGRRQPQTYMKMHGSTDPHMHAVGGGSFDQAVVFFVTMNIHIHVHIYIYIYIYIYIHREREKERDR